MIRGEVELEDHVISFNTNMTTNEVTFKIKDLHTKKEETHVVPGPKFMKALAIAVHWEGTPCHCRDYPDAESIMGDIRWIP